MRLNGKARAEISFGHALIDPRTRRVNRIASDIDVPDRARLTAECHIIADGRRAAYARLRHYQAVGADPTIMPDVNQIVNLGAVPYHRRTHCRPINPDVGADFDIIFDDHIADLRDLRMHAVFGCEPETVSAYHRR